MQICPRQVLAKGFRCREGFSRLQLLPFRNQVSEFFDWVCVLWALRFLRSPPLLRGAPLRLRRSSRLPELFRKVLRFGVPLLLSLLAEAMLQGARPGAPEVSSKPHSRVEVSDSIGSLFPASVLLPSCAAGAASCGASCDRISVSCVNTSVGVKLCGASSVGVTLFGERACSWHATLRVHKKPNALFSSPPPKQAPLRLNSGLGHVDARGPRCWVHQHKLLEPYRLEPKYLWKWVRARGGGTAGFGRPRGEGGEG